MYETPDTEVVEQPEASETEIIEEPTHEAEQPPEAKPESRSNQRIRQLIEEKKLLEQRLQMANLPKPAAVFDEETDARVRQLVRTDPMARQLQSQMLELKLRGANPDYDEHFEDVGSTFNELAAEGFGGEKTAQLILDALRARKGTYTAQGAKQAQEQARARTAAATPSGSASPKPEKSPLEQIFDGSNQNRAQREAYRERVKRGEAIA